MLEPLVRAWIGGLSLLGAQQGTVQEEWTVRVPGSVPCPFVVVGAHGTISVRELSALGQGMPHGEPAPCSWRVDVGGGGPGTTLRIEVAPGTLVRLARAEQYTPVYLVDLRSGGFLLDPCDVDVDGRFNVADFMAFLNAPFDHDGDGGLSVLDYRGLADGCTR